MWDVILFYNINDKTLGLQSAKICSVGILLRI